MKRTTEFELIDAACRPTNKVINIIGSRPGYVPYVSIGGKEGLAELFIKDKDLERLAVNILKALKFKRLKP